MKLSGKYYLFGMNTYGGAPYYEVTDDQTRVLQVIKENYDHETIYNLRVIYGTLLEFEPATVIETFRIKELDDSTTKLDEAFFGDGGSVEEMSGEECRRRAKSEESLKGLK